MKLGLVVNNPKTEVAAYTSTRLGFAATSLGHEVWTIGVGDFIYASDGSLHAHGSRVPGRDYKNVETYHAALTGDKAVCERIQLTDLDVMLLRNDPAQDAIDRPWAQTSGILFAELATLRNVMVLNDPASLARAMNKTYFQHFPEAVRPRTCISRDPEEIKEFIHQEKGKAVLKPLQGSGGQSVFLIQSANDPNTNQMIEAVVRDGYAIVQEYLPAAAKGDTRLFVMNGRPLMSGNKYAALRRLAKKGDLRNNMHAGGTVEPAKVDDRMLRLVEMVRPKLVGDGMWLVGLDIVEDKLMEINVFSPGGLGSAQALTKKDFAIEVIRDLERKVAYQSYYGRNIPNMQLATL
ncbi:MAG: glutathione synthetase [Chthoniobacteraceae bacterium]